ncbi:MAG TPA: ribosome small subunit-dependent GTPase A [Candidatus Cloacimonetes bacterium]|nr:ribosome small subunit-dependent GTPase A [Candidatus Cloacimonadota bacterium]
MSKKKDKKKFLRQNIKLQNIEIGDINTFEEDEVIEEKRAEKKIPQKAETSDKSGLKLTEGRVLEVKTNYRCVVNIDEKELVCTLGGRLKQLNFETRSLVAVGDFVRVDLSENPRIEEILPRKNSLSRFSETSFQIEIIIATNLDQLVIVSSILEPEIKFGLIDRYICAAGIYEITPIICINKIDLARNRDDINNQVRFYQKNGYQIIYTSAKTGEGLENLIQILKDKETVFSGHSGTGKSSLINKIQPGLNLKVMDVSDYSKKGVHTTSSSRLISWDFGGYLVDTPGIKTFGLHRKNKDNIPLIFPGFAELAGNCKYNNCSHSHEHGCAVKKAVEEGFFPRERYSSYLRIWESL